MRATQGAQFAECVPRLRGHVGQIDIQQCRAFRSCLTGDIALKPPVGGKHRNCQHPVRHNGNPYRNSKNKTSQKLS